MRRGGRAKRRLENPIHAYRCDFCRLWHIGAVARKPKKVIKKRRRRAGVA